MKIKATGFKNKLTKDVEYKKEALANIIGIIPSLTDADIEKIKEERVSKYDMKDDYQKYFFEQLQDIDFKETWESSKWKQCLITDLIKARNNNLITQKQFMEMIDYVESNGLKMGKDTANPFIDTHYEFTEAVEKNLVKRIVLRK